MSKLGDNRFFTTVNMKQASVPAFLFTAASVDMTLPIQILMKGKNKLCPVNDVTLLTA